MISQINKYIAFDISLHKTLSQYNFLNLSDKNSLDTLLNLLLENWVNVGYESDLEERIFKNRAMIALANYYVNPLDKGTENLIIDKFVQYKSPENLILLGKVDKLHELSNGLYELIDYKSGKYLPPEDELFKTNKVPKIIYLTYQKFGVYPDLFSYYYLRHNKKFTLHITEDYKNFLNCLF